MEQIHDHLLPDAARMLDASVAARFSFIERDKVIETPAFNVIVGRLQELYSHARILRPPNLAIVGPSGIGKSHAIEEFMTRKRPRRCSNSGQLKVPVLHIEYPPIPSSRWFASTLLKGLGFVMPLPRNNGDLFDKLLEYLEEAATRLIIIEEVNQLEEWPTIHVREFYGVARWLSNQTKIPIVLAGTENVLELLDGDIQLVRRFDRLILEPWPLSAEFGGFVAAYVRTIPMPTRTTVDRGFIEQVHEAGLGITDSTVKVLQRAAKRAIIAGDPCIELRHIGADATLIPPVVAERKVVRRRSKRRRRKG